MNPTKQRASVKRYRRKVDTFLRVLKDGRECKDCKQEFPHYVLEYDHVRGVKLFNVSAAQSIPVLLREVAKCDLVCSNCHAVRTWNRRPR